MDAHPGGNGRFAEGHAPKRILLVRCSAVGDVINTLPALEAIRRGLPDAHLGFIVEDRAYDLIAGHPSVDRVHLFARRRWMDQARNPLFWGKALGDFGRFIREVRRERYEVVLDFQANLKGSLQCIISGVRRRYGFSAEHCKEMSHLFTNHHVTPPGGERINRVDKFLSLASALGVPVTNASYRLPEPVDSRSRVEGFLGERHIDDYVAIHPGTSDFGKAKRWLPERFSSLARRIGDDRGLRCLVTWGPGERDLAESVAEGSNGYAVPAMETRSLMDLAEIIRRAKLFIGCDSGPLHLSSAVRTPSVALFGPKDPIIYGPYNPLRRIVYKGENGHGGSMGDISVDDAYRAVSDLLEEVPAAAVR